MVKYNSRYWPAPIQSACYPSRTQNLSRPSITSILAARYQCLVRVLQLMVLPAKQRLLLGRIQRHLLCLATILENEPSRNTNDTKNPSHEEDNYAKEHDVEPSRIAGEFAVWNIVCCVAVSWDWTWWHCCCFACVTCAGLFRFAF